MIFPILALRPVFRDFTQPCSDPLNLLRYSPALQYKFLAPYWDPISADAKDFVRNLLVVRNISPHSLIFPSYFMSGESSDIQFPIAVPV